jgi:two-component system, NarL family, sensor histidine kinase YdfH
MAQTPPGIDLQDQWLVQKEKTLAWLRLGFSIAAILVVQLNPERVARFPVLSHLSLISFAVYSLVVLIFIVRRNGLKIAKLALATSALDLLWVSLIVFSTGPSPTPFFVYYFFPVVTSSSRYGVKGGVTVAVIGVALYGLIRFSPLSGERLPIDIFVIRSIYLVVLAYIFGFLSEFEQKQSRRLIALNKTAGDAATQEERRRIARELHDRQLQVLATLSLRLEACRKHLISAPHELAGELRLLEDITLNSMADIRRFLSGKDLPSLVPGTLFERLKEEMKFLRDGLGIHVILESEPEEMNLPPRIEQELYYVLREGLTNIARHSQASRAAVLLQESARQIWGSVEDDGIGFDLAEVKGNGRLGLETMEERITRLGGELAIKTFPGRGTKISFTVPVQ